MKIFMVYMNILLFVLIVSFNAYALSPIITVEEKHQADLEMAKELKAMKILFKKCDNGDPTSCESLAELEAYYGETVSAMMSLQKAKSILQKNCNYSDMKGCISLARMIMYTEGNFLEVKYLLEKACYYFENRGGCENLADFEEKMGMGDPSGRKRVCNIVGVWCDRYRGRISQTSFDPPLIKPDDLFSSSVLFYQKLRYQMAVQEWIPRGLTIIPLEMDDNSRWGRGIEY